MASWKVCAAVVCLYGFLKAMRPSEPYLNPYLTQPPINLTQSQVNNEVYPVWTYSYLVALIPTFLLTDLLRYKIVIVFEACCYIATWIMLLFGRGVLTMQFMEFVYGFCTATEIAYYSYIYAVVDSQHYQKVAGYTRSSILMGKFIAAVIGQLLISFDVTDFYTLNIISLGSVSMSLIAALCLPRVQHSMYFHQGEHNTREMRSSEHMQQHPDGCENPSFMAPPEGALSTPKVITRQMSGSVSSDLHVRGRTTTGRADSLNSVDDEGFTRSSYLPFPPSHLTHTDIDTSSLAWSTQSDRFSQSSVGSNVIESPSESMKIPQDNPDGLLADKTPCCAKVKNVVTALWQDFRCAYTQKILLAWSVWWAIASCGNFQVGNYIQTLWDEVDPHRENKNKYNGAIEAAATLLGAISSFMIGLIPANWTAYGELLLGTISLLNCAVLFVMAYTKEIWVAYSLYVFFRGAYQMVITVATFQIARYLEAQRFGLVFGFNTFLALLIETILTAIVVDKRGLNAPITTQFAVNGGYFGVMGLVFFVAAVVNLSRRGCVSCRLEEVPVTETGRQ